MSGFIDLHTHGIDRYDTRTTKPEHILKMAELQGKDGVSAILSTIFSGPINTMRENMEAVRKAIETQKAESRKQKAEGSRQKLMNHTLNSELNSSLVTRHSSLILGVHLEGPFLDPIRCGALGKDFFIKPTISSLKKLIDGYEDIIKIITIAPELPGALKVIEKCVEHGIRVNMGHSDATYKQGVDGKKAGATGITHIFNAMKPFHHREPGLAGFGLLDEDIYIEIIADGVHLHPKTIEIIFAIKRLDRIILVSDSVKGAKKGGCPIYNEKGVLLGSGIIIAESVKILRKIGIPEAEIMEAGIDNPMRYIGLT